ncbi:lysoplasmalogenase [Myxococcus sp. K15C18031901]|uniref:lysoplasmalogenase n=1 Tax=Myxococcus dinghuensis TaxID=2906761 RepID=UPI0020A7EF47|nr:lysoplasmalogenase [Myxococcus dinghuensis]MCP3102315.1 lysoplasmalogenase [Myxococcus dinghuensis]
MHGASNGAVKALAAVGAVGALGFLLTLGEPQRGLRLVTKALPMLCLLAWMWPTRTRYARWILAGLGLSLLGDVLLELGPGFFLPGLGAFLLAHLGYTVAYLQATRAPSPGRALPFLVLAVGASVLLHPWLGEMTVPVTLYVAVICTMAWRAAALMNSAEVPRQRQWTAFAGALLFAASDGLLAIKLFVRPLPGGSYAVMLLYWAAQLSIAWSAREPREAPLEAHAPTAA